MKLDVVLLVLGFFFFAVTVIIGLFASRFFKKHEAQYGDLLSEYRARGFDIDLMTNYLSFFGSFFNYFKIIWFVRLYKGVQMKFTRDRQVQPEAYHFIQTLPAVKIDWMLKLHRLYIMQFITTTFWFVAFGLFHILYK